MMRQWLARGFAVLMLLSAGIALGQQYVPIPPLKARITDLAGVLPADGKSRLEARLATFEQSKGSQLAVLVVPTTQPESIEQYSLRVAEAWRLGRKGIDDGALLLVAVSDKSLRIEVGYGLEGVLTDAVAKRIISEVIVPYFKRGDYAAGIDAGIDAMIGVISGEALPAPSKSSPDGSGSLYGSLESILPVLIAGVFVVGGVLRAILGRLIAASIMGGVAGLIAWLLVSSIVVAGIVGAIAFFVALFGGMGGRGIGGGGFSTGGGSSGGGFSGGGGGFGGGGASGKW